MAVTDVRLDDKVELTLPANENDYIYILRQVAGGGFSVTDYKIKVRNLVGDTLGYPTDGDITTPAEGTTYFNTTDKEMRGYDGSVWHDMYNNIITTKVSLTAAQIKTLGTTPIEAIVAPGVGKYIKVLAADGAFTYGTVAFDNNNLIIESDGAITYWLSKSAFIGSTADLLDVFEVDFGGSIIKENAAINITGTDSVATGDSTIDVYITYEIITL